MKEYKHLIYDYDGCLCRSLSCWIASIRSVSQEFGLKLSREQVNEQLGELMAVGKHGLDEEKVPKYIQSVLSIARPKAQKAPLYTGVKESLVALKVLDKTLALVSSNTGGLLVLMAGKGIKEYFDVIITGTDVKVKKPDPEGIEKALARMNADKRSSVMIGDSSHDLLAAKKAGIDSILFHPKSHSRFYDLNALMRHNPTEVVTSHAELVKRLSRRRALV